MISFYLALILQFYARFFICEKLKKKNSNLYPFNFTTEVISHCQWRGYWSSSIWDLKKKGFFSFLNAFPCSKGQRLWFFYFYICLFLPIALVRKRLENSSAKGRKLWVGSQIPAWALPKNRKQFPCSFLFIALFIDSVGPFICFSTCRTWSKIGFQVKRVEP